MHHIIGFVLSILVLFPASDDAVADLYHRWMRSYEMHLMAQIEENFRNEQKTGEEAEVTVQQTEESVDIHEEVPTEASTVERTEEHIPASQENTQADQNYPVYQVDSYIPDEALQTYLYQRLNENGIGFFMPYAVCLIAQESTWNPLAENKNGLDKGLLQYRTSFWPTLEWWNPYAEIDVFVQQMANRAARGLTVSQMISAHNQSDWGPYCQEYVDAVMQHSERLVRIR